MPEEGIETQELRDQLEEAREHAHGHAHGEGAPSWTTALSLSTAIIAVLAAIASLESGTFANDALLAKNHSIHATTIAADHWNRFQAKGIKQDLYDAEARFTTILAPAPRSATDAGPAAAAAVAEDLARFEKTRAFFEGESRNANQKKGDAEHDACCAEHDSEHFDEESAGALHRHHLFARSVTIFQVAIAISAIGALTKKKFMWFVSLFAGVGGIVFFVLGLMPPPAEHASPHHESSSSETCAKYGADACHAPAPGH